jgi:hypothetical protein
MALMGCATYKITSKCYIFIFGCLLSSVWIANVTTGAIFSATAIGAPILAAGICAQAADGYLGYGPKIILTNYMCTNACPCNPSAQANFNSMN